MVRKSFMIIAGETSGDMLAAQLVRSLRDKWIAIQAVPSGDSQPLETSLEPRFFGAGGSHLAETGVAVSVDMTAHAVVGLWEVIKNYTHFRRIFRQLVNLAIQREPDAIICVDFSGFNLRFARAIRQYTRSLEGTFGNWKPWIIQYVSPQVWASRPERARHMAKNIDLLLSILPFEKEWYAERVPQLRVEFVGHPLIDRYKAAGLGHTKSGVAVDRRSNILLLPGSRIGEVKRHLPVLLGALDQIRSSKPLVQARLVLPNESLTQLARTFSIPPNVSVQTGEMASALSQTDLAIASTGTVTLECAYFGVPTIALYKTSWSTYWVAKQLIQVKFLAMPNLLAGQQVFPEFIQDAATPENLARAALEILDHPDRSAAIRSQLAKIIPVLGQPGASTRAANAIADLMTGMPRPLRAALVQGL